MQRFFKSAQNVKRLAFVPECHRKARVNRERPVEALKSFITPT
jgi:hypothetical protein